MGLRLRKHKLNEVANVENQLLNVMEMVDKIEGKEREIDLLQALKAGKDALEHLHKEISVDEVIDLMDKVGEQVEVERQINDAIEQGVVGLSDIDENEVEEELKKLENEMGVEKEKQEEETTLELPEVPN